MSEDTATQERKIKVGVYYYVSENLGKDHSIAKATGSLDDHKWFPCDMVPLEGKSDSVYCFSTEPSRGRVRHLNHVLREMTPEEVAEILARSNRSHFDF